VIVGNSALPHIFSGIFWGLEARAPFTNNDTSDAPTNTATLATIGSIGKLAVYSSDPKKDRKKISYYLKLDFTDFYLFWGCCHQYRWVTGWMSLCWIHV
jgi:hypothetical protein